MRKKTVLRSWFTISLLAGMSAALSLSAPQPALAAARVGTGGSNSCAACTSLAVTIPATTAGDTLILVAGTNDAAAGGVTAVSGGGCTWTKATGASGVNGGGPSDHAIWYCPNTTAGQTTVTLTISTWDTSAVVQEYSGVLTASPLDKTVLNNTAAQGTALSSGTTAATTQANELLIGGFTVGGNATFSTPGGTNGTWTLNLSRSATNVSTAMTDNLSNSAATSSASLTSSASNWWVGSVATFLPAGGNVSIGNGAVVSNATATQSTTNNAIDSFTAVMSGGSGSISTLTLTVSTNFTAANVSNISLYTDNGTLGVYNSGVDMLVPSTYTISSPTATITITSPVSVTTTTSNYLVTVDVASGATAGNTLTARVTGVSGTSLGTPVYNDSASATLTIASAPCVTANPTVTITTGNQNVAAGGNVNYSVTVTNNDSASCSQTNFNLSKTDTPATPNTNFNATTLPASTGLLSGGTATTFSVNVSAPAGATNGSTETTSVTATGIGHTAVTSNNVTSTVTACTRANPTVTLTPSSLSVSPSGSAYYTATVTNNDSSVCAGTTFILSVTDSPVTPNANFNAATLPANTGLLSGGTSTTFTVTVSAPGGATNASSETTSIATASDANHTAVTSNTATSTIVVVTGNTRGLPAGNNMLYLLLICSMLVAVVIKSRKAKRDASR